MSRVHYQSLYRMSAAEYSRMVLMVGNTILQLMDLMEILCCHVKLHDVIIIS